jgi:CheY-like chemotaxis protein
MTHGGFLRNSIMLVRGPTGRGKTMLAGVFARAGALRGERVVYYGFEEPRHTLIRNFDAVDLEIGELVRAGNLKLVCRYPEATSLEEEGFVVTPVASAEQGLAVLRQYEFDAVVTDYALPGGDGARMLREAAGSGRLADTPAFIVTGHHDMPIPGEFAVIPKPLNLDGLLREVRRVVDGGMTAEGRRRTHLRRDRHASPDGNAARRDGDRQKTPSSSCSSSAPRPCIPRRRCGTSVRCWPSSTAR